MKLKEVKELAPYDPITYTPNHCLGNAGHKDAEKGVFIGLGGTLGSAKFLNCKTRTIQIVRIENLVEG